MSKKLGVDSTLKHRLSSLADGQKMPASLPGRIITAAVNTHPTAFHRPWNKRWIYIFASTLGALAVVGLIVSFVTGTGFSRDGGVDRIGPGGQASSGPVFADLPTTPPTGMRQLPSAGVAPTCQFPGAGVDPFGLPTSGSPVTVDPDPIAITVVWIPGLDATSCIAVLTHGNAALAKQVAQEIRNAAAPPPGTRHCPSGDGSRVLLYFSYQGQAQAQTVEYNIGGGCVYLLAPGRVGREPGQLGQSLVTIAPTDFRKYLG